MKTAAPRGLRPLTWLPKSRWLLALRVVLASIAGWWLGCWSNCEICSRFVITRRPQAVAARPSAAHAVCIPERLMKIVNDSKAWSFDRVNAARELLEFGTDEEATEALRALGRIGSSAAVAVLSRAAASLSWPEELRVEAIQGLRNINNSGSARALESLLAATTEEPLREQLVAALGNVPWSEIGPAFEPIINSQDSAPDLRVAAVEALSRTTPDALPLLQGLLGSDADPSVRAAAAWAMSCIKVDQPYGPELAGLAASEQDTMVRRRIYEALLTQADDTARSIAQLIHSETNLPARVAGLNALGDSVSRSMDPGLIAAFDAEDVPELTRIAESDETVNLRMRAVFALRRASTPQAMAALAEIAETPAFRVAIAARNGLKMPRS